MEELNLVVSAGRLGARPDPPANHAMIANSSGDTRYNENMVEFSTGADLLPQPTR
jgi:ribonuclease BN (tRNA processing enzyme)